MLANSSRYRPSRRETREEIKLRCSLRNKHYAYEFLKGPGTTSESGRKNLVKELKI